MIIKGKIGAVLQKGEYDQGDKVMIYYDDLYNLVLENKYLKQVFINQGYDINSILENGKKKGII